MKIIRIALFFIYSSAYAANYPNVTQEWCEANFKNTTSHLLGGACKDLVIAKKMLTDKSTYGFDYAKKISLNNVENIKKAYFSQKDITGKAGGNTMQLIGAYLRFFRALQAGYTAMSNKAVELGMMDLAYTYTHEANALNEVANDFELVTN